MEINKNNVNTYINDQDFSYLETLAKLNIQDKIHFTNNFNTIVSYLKQIKDIDIKRNIKNKNGSTLLNSHSLVSQDGVTPIGEKNILKNNVQHEILNNSIVVGSVLDK